MKKIVTVIGARPQFIKAAVISRLIRTAYKENFIEIIVHTGQHYDRNMSEIFFNEMNIPFPDVNLAVGSGSHGRMTGEMLIKIEEVLIREKPDWVLVYGDTNSTLAGALAASKMNISVAHIEAGLRSFSRIMPEEQNRIITDHLSSLLFCPTDIAVRNLACEGIGLGSNAFARVVKCGDIMYDATLYYRNLMKNSRYRPAIELPKEFFLMTIHRAENTDNVDRLRTIIQSLNDYTGMPGIIPLHPRTVNALKLHGLTFKSTMKVIDPVGFFDMLFLEEHCSFIITDSGGVQKEAYFSHKPCITIRDQTEWKETVETGWNILTGADPDKISRAMAAVSSPSSWNELYGDGKAGEQILNEMAGANCGIML